MKRNLARVLKQKLPALKRLFASDQRVLGVFLFGSQADGSATPRSDVDLAVLFDRDLEFKEELAFEVAISNVLHTDDVDVVNLNRASLAFRFRAISGKLLYERDRVRVSDFVERTMIEHRDFEPRAQAAIRDYFATL
ncbi:MAG: nucleotidyltransferase domain-containing protein [Chloroflexota bacterium]|nr:nucleotidyltransferase domain-containing protein [Chloroflexota bacterium]